jgi:hypothetical protein
LRMPKMGRNIPRMGRQKTTARRRRESSLADALFSTTQQRVLGLIFGQPERSFYATELIGLAGAGSGAVQRELARLEQSGLVTVRRLGTQKHYQANPASPLFGELASIARKTVGLAEPLREALVPLASRVIAAFVYGSAAKRRDTAASDIDLMVVSLRRCLRRARAARREARSDDQPDRVQPAGAGQAPEGGQRLRDPRARTAQGLDHRHRR